MEIATKPPVPLPSLEEALIVTGVQGLHRDCVGRLRKVDLTLHNELKVLDSTVFGSHRTFKFLESSSEAKYERTMTRWLTHLVVSTSAQRVMLTDSRLDQARGKLQSHIREQAVAYAGPRQGQRDRHLRPEISHILVGYVSAVLEALFLPPSTVIDRFEFPAMHWAAVDSFDAHTQSCKPLGLNTQVFAMSLYWARMILFRRTYRTFLEERLTMESLQARLRSQV